MNSCTPLTLDGGFHSLIAQHLSLSIQKPSPDSSTPRKLIRFVELAFLWIEEYFGLAASLKEVLNCRDVTLYIRGMDIGIVQVSQEDLQQLWLVIEMVIYEFLEVGQCVHQSKGEDVRLVRSVWGVERGEPLLSLLNPDLVVARFHVKLRKDLGSLYPIHDLIDSREQVGISDGDIIEFSIVNYWSFSSIFLSNEKHWGCGWTLV